MTELVKSLFFSLIAIVFLIPIAGYTQQVKPTLIADIDSLMSKEAKPILILLSTDWCQYCQMQKIQLRKNKAFIKNLNQYYYIEFDAEQKAPVVFNGKEYVYKPTGAKVGIHQLAQMLNGPDPLSFPKWVVLSPTYEVLFRHNGVLLPNEVDKLVALF